MRVTLRIDDALKDCLEAVALMEGYSTLNKLLQEALSDFAVQYENDLELELTELRQKLSKCEAALRYLQKEQLECAWPGDVADQEWFEESDGLEYVLETLVPKGKDDGQEVYQWEIHEVLADLKKRVAAFSAGIKHFERK